MLDDVVLLFLTQEKNLESQTLSILRTVEINLRARSSLQLYDNCLMILLLSFILLSIINLEINSSCSASSYAFSDLTCTEECLVLSDSLMLNVSCEILSCLLILFIGLNLT